MKPFMVIKEPEAFELLADETRRKILYLLRVKDMNVSQIATELGMTSQAIYHHVRRLLKANMIEVVREERTGHLIESYYRATAEDFLLTTGKIGAKTLHNRKLVEEQLTAVLNAFKKLGFKLELDQNRISQLADLWVGILECCPSSKKLGLEDEIWNMDELSLLEKTMANDVKNYLMMSDDEFNRNEKNRKKFRAFLLSLLKEEEKQEKINPVKA